MQSEQFLIILTPHIIEIEIPIFSWHVWMKNIVHYYIIAYSDTKELNRNNTETKQKQLIFYVVFMTIRLIQRKGDK